MFNRTRWTTICTAAAVTLGAAMVTAPYPARSIPSAPTSTVVGSKVVASTAVATTVDTSP